MKYLIIGLTTLFCSCSFPETNPANISSTTVGDTYHVTSAYEGNGTTTLYTYTVDSCEYIGTRSLNTNYGMLTHKGNCKYCIQRNNKK